MVQINIDTNKAGFHPLKTIWEDQRYIFGHTSDHLVRIYFGYLYLINIHDASTTKYKIDDIINGYYEVLYCYVKDIKKLYIILFNGDSLQLITYDEDTKKIYVDKIISFKIDISVSFNSIYYHNRKLYINRSDSIQLIYDIYRQTLSTNCSDNNINSISNIVHDNYYIYYVNDNFDLVRAVHSRKTLYNKIPSAYNDILIE